MAINVDVSFHGPIWTADVGARFQKGAENVIRRMMEFGDANLASLLRKAPEGVYLSDGKSTGYYRSNVTANFTEGSLEGLITDNGVIYGPWLEGVSSRNDTTRFKGYAAFRRTKEAIDAKAGEFLAAEAADIMRDLGGDQR